MLSLWQLEERDALLSAGGLAWLFGSLIAIGLSLNLLVIYKMKRLARADRDQFFNGTGIYLCVMAITDVFSLLSVFSHLALSIAAPLVSLRLAVQACKLFVFVSRVSFTLSAYCWLFMSGLRYLAAFHPLQYSTVWRSPISSLATVVFVAILLNLHVLVSVGADENLGCVLSVDTLSSLYSLADTMVSFVVPSAVIFYMDIRVLCLRTKRRSSDPLLQIVFHKMDEEAEKRRAATMKRFMSITLVNLVISMPDSLLWSLRTTVADSAVLALIPVPVFVVAKAFYFFKTSFNAFYLTSFVFDRNLLSKTSSSRQLSLSARRLEESPAIQQRQRAHTVAARPSTPVPEAAFLTRNSSCIFLDHASASSRRASAESRQWV